MKIAQLHDGSQLQFDPNLSDDAMDAAVRAHMGVQEQPQPDPAMMQLAQTFMQLAGVMQNGIKTIVQTQQQLAQQVSQLGQMLAQQPGDSQEAQAIAQLAGVVDHAVQRIEAALSQPKRLIMDKDGRPVGVSTGGTE